MSTEKPAEKPAEKAGPEPTTIPNPHADKVAALADILNAALEHVPPHTRALLGRSAQGLLTEIAAPIPIPPKPEK